MTNLNTIASETSNSLTSQTMKKIDITAANNSLETFEFLFNILIKIDENYDGSHNSFKEFEYETIELYNYIDEEKQELIKMIMINEMRNRTIDNSYFKNRDLRNEIEDHEYFLIQAGGDFSNTIDEMFDRVEFYDCTSFNEYLTKMEIRYFDGKIEIL